MFDFTGYFRRSFSPDPPAGDGKGPALSAYFLGKLDFDDALNLQRHLVDESARGGPAALVLCEHGPMVTVGRNGSHLHLDQHESPARIPIRWINRAGGCWPHAEGQLAVYAVLPLRQPERGLEDVVSRMSESIIATLAEFSISASTRPNSPDVWAGGRPIACVGLAVRDWTTYFGAIINVNPDLRFSRSIQTGSDHPAMTSLAHERHGPVPNSMVRERFLEHFSSKFQFERTSLFMEHPMLERKAVRHAVLAAC